MNMSPTVFDNVKNVFNQAWTFVKGNASLWHGRMVAYIKNGAFYLQDPRYASGAVFAVNFGIFEVALRISNLVELFLPKETIQAKVSRVVILSGVMVAGNVYFLRAARVSLHPLVVAAIAIASLVARKELQGYVANK